MRAGFLNSATPPRGKPPVTPPHDKPPAPSTPTTVAATRTHEAGGAGLIAQAALPKTFKSLRDRGYACLVLGAEDEKVIGEATVAADAALEVAPPPLLSVKAIARPLGSKRVVTVGRSPMHEAEALLKSYEQRIEELERNMQELLAERNGHT